MPRRRTAKTSRRKQFLPAKDEDGSNLGSSGRAVKVENVWSGDEDFYGTETRRVVKTEEVSPVTPKTPDLKFDRYGQ